MNYAFRLSKTLIETSWSDTDVNHWQLTEEFSQWCEENLQHDYVFSFVGDSKLDTDYYWASYYWLLLTDEGDAMILKLSFPEEVFPLALSWLQ